MSQGFLPSKQLLQYIAGNPLVQLYLKAGDMNIISLKRQQYNTLIVFPENLPTIGKGQGHGV